MSRNLNRLNKGNANLNHDASNTTPGPSSRSEMRGAHRSRGQKFYRSMVLDQNQSQSRPHIDSTNHFKRGDGRRRGRGRRNYESNHTRQSNNQMETEEKNDIPGFVWDPIKKRYFRISSDLAAAGVQGAVSQSTCVNHQKQAQLQIEQDLPCGSRKDTASSFCLLHLCDHQKNTCLSAPHSLTLSVARQMKRIQYTNQNRLLIHKRLSCMPSTNQNSQSITILSPMGVLFDDRTCQQIVNANGDALVGVWSTMLRGQILSTTIKCIQFELDQNEDGSTLKPKEHCPDFIDSNQSFISDMCLANVDSDVRCVLYANDPQLVGKGSRICMKPVSQLSRGHEDFFESPIYNVDWTMHKQNIVSAVGWNSKRMSLGLAMDTYAVVVDVIARQDFCVSTKHKRSICMQFTPDGSTMYLGRERSSLIGCDLRLHKHHTSNKLPINSVYYIKLLADENYMVTAAYQDKLCLWDLRQRKIVTTYENHKNTHYKLSVDVNEEDSLIFAVGDDGTTRGWSLLGGGEPLCCVPPPLPIFSRPCIPRMCYSNRWAGIPANSAILLMVKDKVFQHFL